MLRLTLAADGPMNRLRSLVQIANMADVPLHRLQFDLDDVKQLRGWLDVLAKQVERTRPRYKPLLTKLDEHLGGFTITWQPKVDVDARHMQYTASYDIPNNLSIMAFIVGEAFNSDLHKRVGRCPECIRRRDKRIIRGKPVDLKDGPYFVRYGRGDTRKYCTARHTRAVVMREKRRKAKLQLEGSAK